jgi:hypothetical protein
MQSEAGLQRREPMVFAQVPDRLYGSIDAAKVRIEPRAKQGKKEVVEEDCVLVRRRVGTQPPTFCSTTETGATGRDSISSQKQALLLLHRGS